jgi:hypothetical protein
MLRVLEGGLCSKVLEEGGSVALVAEKGVVPGPRS